MALLKRTAFYFLPPALLLLLVLVALFAAKRSAEWTILQSREMVTLEQQQEKIDTVFRSVISDLHVLAAHFELQRLLSGGNDDHRGHLAKEFLAFAGYKRIYDQARFLDDRGMERVRIDFRDNRPTIVADEHLQDKSLRYYFQDTFSLNRQQVFISPFDLNIEHGAVEQPRKPMLRFGTPVFDGNGRKRGVVILNYLGNHLLQQMAAKTQNSSGQLMLLNSEGFWLKGVKAEDEWGFMYKDTPQLTFAKRYPEQWQRMIGTESGQFVDEQGLFSYTTVYPLLQGAISSDGSNQPLRRARGWLPGKIISGNW